MIGSRFVTSLVRRQRALRRRFNPYVAGTPVFDPALFFGREEKTRAALAIVRERSLIVTGEPRIGKTSFLYHLRRALVSPPPDVARFAPVVVDLEGVPEQDFFSALRTDLLDALRPDEAPLAPESRGYGEHGFAADLERVLDGLRQKAGTNVRVVLLVDEGDAVNEYSESFDEQLSRTLARFSGGLVALLTATRIRPTWRAGGRLLAGLVEEIELPAFTRDDAEALVLRPVAGVFEYEAQAVSRILELSRLKPYRIQKLCLHAVNRMLEGNRTIVQASDVEAVRGLVARETT